MLSKERTRFSVRLTNVDTNIDTTTQSNVEHIRSVLDSTHWRVRGANGAAEKLGVKPTTLETRMARLGIRRP